MPIKPQKPKSTNIVSGLDNTANDNLRNNYLGDDVPLKTGNDDHKNKTGKKSMFHDYSILYYRGTDREIQPYVDSTEVADKRNKIRNATYIDLVNNQEGANLYKAQDFIYTKGFDDQVPINRLVTLRRFPYPAPDNIFSNQKVKLYDKNGQPTGEGSGLQPDIGRLLTFSTAEDNPLSEIMTTTGGYNYKELKSDIQSVEGRGQSGMLGTISKYIDPAVANQELQNPNARDIDPLHDTNKVYGDVDVIDQMKIRDRGLNWTYSVSLNFTYKLKSIGGRNPRVAMMDILGNIFSVVTSTGRFWGGSRAWYGKAPSSFIGSISSLNSRNIDDFVNKAWGDLRNGVQALAKNGKELAKTVLTNIATLKVGKFLDFMGRPEVYALNSLLTGDPTGDWHLTIGNPLDPTMAIGNLIINDWSLQFGDTLGLDNFPTELILTVNLESAMPRDRAGQESIYNAGQGRIYNSMREETVNKLYKGTVGGTRRGIFTQLVSDSVDRAWVFGKFGTPDVKKSGGQTF